MVRSAAMIEVRAATAGDATAIATVHVQVHRETYPQLLGETSYQAPTPARPWTAEPIEL